jgi:hypothetical protein
LNVAHSLGGPKATSIGTGLTPEGSQPLEERPHAATTLKGSQPVFHAWLEKQPLAPSMKFHNFDVDFQP